MTTSGPRTDIPIRRILLRGLEPGPLFCLAIALEPFSGKWDLMGIPFPLNRLALAGAFASLVYARRSTARQSVIRQWSAVLAFTCFSTWAFLSALTHGTLLLPDSAFALLDRIFLPCLFFFVLPHILSTPRDRDLAVKTLIWIGAYLGAISLLSTVGPQALVFPAWIMDESLGIQFGRARGPFLQSPANGLAMIICGAIAVVGLVRFSKPWRVLSVLVMALCGVGSLLTYTRSIWLGAIFAAVAIALSDARFRKYFPAAAMATVILFWILLLNVPQVAATVQSRTSDTMPLDDRASTNQAAIEMLLAHPISGVGWGRFLDQISFYAQQPDLQPLGNVNIEAHNVLLSRGAELGLVGAMLWLVAMSVGPLRAALPIKSPASDELLRWQSCFRAILGAYVIVAMLTPLGYPFANYLVWGFAGMVMARRMP